MGSRPICSIAEGVTYEGPVVPRRIPGLDLREQLLGHEPEEVIRPSPARRPPTVAFPRRGCEVTPAVCAGDAYDYRGGIREEPE